MRPATAIIFVALFGLSISQDTTTDGDSNKLNSIESKPSARLDPYIRKALLKALSELEEGDNPTTGTDSTDTSIDLDTYYKTDDDSTQSPRTLNPGIQIHSFIVNGQSAFDNSTNIKPTLIDSNISILSTTAGNVENHSTSSLSTLPTQTPFNEIFLTKASGINIQQVRSIPTTSKHDNVDKEIPTVRSTPSTTTTTITTTTTTTTPKPTHNDDGENIEEVDKRDVQVFQAPLVAAFTVHQDAQGLPKKVIPLFQQTNVQDALNPQPATNLHTGVLPPLTIRQTLPIQNIHPQNDYISQQIILQRQLEEKQRILEEQLRILQLQQRQQEELLRKQQIILQQKEAQRLQQLQVQQQQKLPISNPASTFQLPKPVQQTTFLSQNTGNRPQNAQVYIQSSVSLDQGSFVSNQQQLPNREAVDFLLHLRNQQSEQFPLQENHLPQGISNFLQPNTIQNIHQGVNFNQIRTNDFGQKHGNRVFRQESGVGNFGVFNNQNYNRFNTFNPSHTHNFFPQTNPNNFSPDLELKQLLLQTGLNGRSQEDLNIVSKVLSLNHGIPFNNNISNRLPFDSRGHRTVS